MLLRNHYQIISELGQGGFGKTYLAEDLDHPKRQKVVVKELIPQDDHQLFQIVRERFDKEAERLAELDQGPKGGIPEFHAHFTENEKCYIVQEFIDGGSLASKLKKDGPLSEAFVLEILKQILPVLDYIHTQTNPIIHRDIKPANIMLRAKTGQPVLFDFGIVKDVTKVGLHGNPTDSILAGTSGYMPIEQGVGRPVFSSDLFALGMTAIVLMTGKSPQELTNPLTGEIDWQKFVPSINPEFAAALNKATRPQYQERFATANQMLDAIRDLAPVNLMAATSDPRFYDKTTRPYPSPNVQKVGLEIPARDSDNSTAQIPSPTPVSAPKSTNPPGPVPTSPSLMGAGGDPAKSAQTSSERKGKPRFIKVATLAVAGIALISVGGFGAKWLLSSKFADIPPEMVRIKGGTFIMGNTQAMVEDPAEGPEHVVTVGDFLMDLTEVTNQDFNRFAKETNLPWKPEGADDLPATNVTWNEANAYAKWAGKRLPTEEEWEYAARGNDRRLYPWGNDFSANKANVRESGLGKPVSVNAFPEDLSPFGLRGMCGNVAEWVVSDFRPYPNSRVKQFPGKKLVRGASFLQDVSVSRTTCRLLSEPLVRSSSVGFRCAKDITSGIGK